MRCIHVTHKPPEGFYMGYVNAARTYFGIDYDTRAIVCGVSGVDEHIDLSFSSAYSPFHTRIWSNAVCSGELVGYEASYEPFVSFPFRYRLSHLIYFDRST
jgi:hypothetical protein